LNGRDEEGEATANNKLDEAKEGGAVDVDEEVDDRLHDGQGEDECGAGTLHRVVDGLNHALVGGDGHVAREARGTGRGLLSREAARDEVLLCARYRTAGRVQGELEAEGDEEEGENGVREPCERNQVGELEVRLEGRAAVVGRRALGTGDEGHDSVGRRQTKRESGRGDDDGGRGRVRALYSAMVAI
jgi:hypothetical protein